MGLGLGSGRWGRHTLLASRASSCGASSGMAVPLPPPPKVKISNLMQAMKDDAVAGAHAGGRG